MQGACDICVVIKLRLLNRRPNTCSRRQMHDRVEFFVVSKQRCYSLAVAKIDFLDRGSFRERSNVRALDPGVIVIIEVVNDHNVMTIGQQSFDKMRANESSAASDQNLHWSGTSTTKDTKCTKKIYLFSALKFLYAPASATIVFPFWKFAAHRHGDDLRGAMKRTIWLSALAFVLAFIAMLGWKLWPELTRPKSVDPAFQIPSPLELESIPTASHFDFPLGNENGAMAYN